MKQRRSGFRWWVGLSGVLCLLCALLLVASCKKKTEGARSVGGPNPAASAISTGAGRVHALLIGVNSYRYDWKKLDYAERDVRALRDVLVKKGRLPEKNIQLLLGADATAEHALQKIEDLQGLATENDTVLLFFAGHGHSYNNESYLILHDTSLNELRTKGLSSARLSSGWKTQRLVVMLDACHSGVKLKGARGDSTLGVDSAKFAGLGRVVLSSSRQSQKSYEVDQLGHGLFSYALMEALEGKADANDDGVVTMHEAYLYVHKRVVAMAREHKGQQQEPVLNAQVAGEIPLSYPGKKQVLGLLVVSMNVGGVEVYVDGVYKAYVGRAGKKKRLKLSVGRHDVVLKKRGYAEKRLQVEIEGGGELPLEGVLEEEGGVQPVVRRPEERVAAVRVGSSQSSASVRHVAGTRKVHRVGGVEFAVRWIPAGTFMMGSPSSEPGHDGDEGPRRRVRISKGFWMMESEVTQGLYKAVMCSNPSHFKGCGENCPVEEVSWHDARLFGEKLSAAQGLAACGATDRGIFQCKGWRLPTEAEWEYAARAGTKSSSLW